MFSFKKSIIAIRLGPTGEKCFDDNDNNNNKYILE